MKRERVLITVKTYPTLSTSHIELVCTAGLREDGSWVRIYPVPFRLLERESQFHKWTWIELPLERRVKDKRPESYSPVDRNDIRILDTIPTADGWRERRRMLFLQGGAWSDLTRLIEAGKRNELSLATFKPKRMLAFDVEKADSDWDERRLAAVEAQLRQADLLEGSGIRENFVPVKKVPYDFYYRFEDEAGRESRLRILDWEIGALYWNCLKGVTAGEDAVEKVRHMYEVKFFECDLHLLLGTTLEWHDRGPNPWVIVGLVPLPHRNQLDLFEDL